MLFCFIIYLYLFFLLFLFFFFNDTATTEIYTLSLHDALPISDCPSLFRCHHLATGREPDSGVLPKRDRKSTRLNSSHTVISYAVFCLKKKKKKKKQKIFTKKKYKTKYRIIQN